MATTELFKPAPVRWSHPFDVVKPSLGSIFNAIAAFAQRTRQLLLRLNRVSEVSSKNLMVDPQGFEPRTNRL